MRPVLWEWQKERLEEDLVPDLKGVQGPWAEWGTGVRRRAVQPGPAGVRGQHAGARPTPAGEAGTPWGPRLLLVSLSHSVCRQPWRGDRNSGVRRVRHTWFKGCNFVGIAEPWEVPILRCHPQTLASAAPWGLRGS